MDNPYRFCTACASPLELRFIDGRDRPVCTHCARVVYLDPKVATSCIASRGGQLLMIRRAIEPGYGLWTFPGGYVELGETVTEAAVRETWEEAGLRIELTGLIGVYSYPGRPVVIIFYHGRVVDENPPQPNAECLEARYFKLAEIPYPELAFPSTRDALRDYLSAPH